MPTGRTCASWEPYSLTWQNDSLPFKRAKAAHGKLIEGILFSLADEHRSAHLDRHADEAIALIARLHSARRWICSSTR